MRRPTLALLLRLLAACLPLLCHQAGAGTLLHYVSEPGEPIGNGQEQTVNAADGTPFTVSGNPRYLVFQVNGSTNLNRETYSVAFAVPLRSSLTVGEYPNATRYAGFDQAGGPGLDFSIDGGGTYTENGRFEILEASYDANYQVVSFAANFVVHCSGRSTAIYGELRYNSGVPYTTAAGVAQFSADNARVLATGGPQQVLSVARHGSSAGTLSVDYATTDGTDLAGRDYTPVSGTLTWADGDSTPKPITIPILNSGNPLQGDGTFRLDLSGPGAGTQSHATVTVVNDNSAVTFLHFQSDPGDPIGGGQERTLNLDGQWLITPGSGYYGQNLSFTATSSLGTVFPASAEFRLDLAPAGGGKTLAVGDYQNATDSMFVGGRWPGLSFFGYGSGVGKLTGNFQVLEAVYDDAGNVLRFAANFEQHDQGNIAALYGQIRYNSTVPLPPARITQVGVAATVATTYDYVGNVPAVFTITRSGSTAQPLTVTYQVSGSAAAGRDYVPLTGRKTIKAGRSSAKVLVEAVYGGRADHSTSVTLKLKLTPQDGVYGAIGTVRPAKVKIVHWGR